MLDLKKEFKINLNVPVPALNELPPLKLKKDLAYFLDDGRSDMSEPDFERAEEEEKEEIITEWLEDDGLIKVRRDPDDDVDYESDSDKEST
jgi:hypothetical protein